jgi:hypothetical protein
MSAADLPVLSKEEIRRSLETLLAKQRSRYLFAFWGRGSGDKLEVGGGAGRDEPEPRLRLPSWRSTVASTSCPSPSFLAMSASSRRAGRAVGGSGERLAAILGARVMRLSRARAKTCPRAASSARERGDP